MHKKGILVAFVGLFLFGCATTQNVSRFSQTSKELSQTKKLATFDVPIVVNDRVMAWIDYFQGPAHRHFARYLARSGRYIPQMQAQLKKYALPQDLVYLAMIESGFSAKAYSRARAAGHWQFINSTGKLYNLEISTWVDERRDPEKSANAAARFLRDLYDQFGNWYLAMAAYNAGPAKISKAISRNGTRDFFEMIERDRHYLRSETKDYVPKFIAAAIISKSPERFGFGDVVYDTPIELETATVDSQTDFDVIAKCAGVSASLIEDLNPELVHGTTPADTKNYTINLPHGTAKKFEVAFAEVPVSERVMVVRYVVRRGDSIGKIARRYGVSAHEILVANDLSRASSVKKGMTLIIPTGGAARAIAGSIASAEEGRPRGRLLKHRVRRGETLGLIAQNYDVSVSELKRWNQLKRNLVHTGQLIKIYNAEESSSAVASRRSPKERKGGLTYSVRRGDSWWKVAQKYGVSINELKFWNPRVANRDLAAGQKLKLFAENLVASSAKVSEPIMSVETDTSDKLMSPAEPKQNLQTISSESDMLQLQKQQPEKRPSDSGVHKIRSGDTLWDIARKYGVSVKNIQTWNNLNSASRLKPGNVLKLSQN